MNIGVDAERDVVANTVDGAAEEVETGAEISDGCWGKRPDGGVDGFGIGGEDGIRGKREVASE